ncbi:MAG TPA: efflux transporter outer membrane subunit [Phenylobacterium sp.]|jgi:multidrug efflux system outer membrane protein
MPVSSLSHACALALTLALAAPAALAASLPSAAAFSEAGAPQAVVARPDPQWWRAFGDPVLEDLVTRGLRDGVSVEEAAARLAQARAHLVAADATRRPAVTLDANASAQGGPLINAIGASGGLVEASARLSYELDIFGRLSKGRQAARSDVRAGEALLRDARLLTAADIARTYVSLRVTDEEARLLAASAADARETLRITEGRRQSGFETDVAVARAQAELGEIDADALSAERRRHELLHALAFLVGDPALALPIAVGPLEAPPTIPAGIPSTVLDRRPDVGAARSALDAAALRLGVARTAWLPSLNLTASGGFASPQLGELIGSSVRSLGLDLLMALPPFDGGRRKSGIAAARADLDLAQAHYRRQVLTAFRDVDDQLSALRLLEQQTAVAGRTVEAADRALALSTSRRGNGLASQLEVLDARRADLRDRRAALQVRGARYLATISLIQAMGGGWDAGSAGGPQGAN